MSKQIRCPVCRARGYEAPHPGQHIYNPGGLIREPEIPIGEVELVNVSRRRQRQFNQQQALAYAVARYGSEQLPLGDPFEPMDQLVARAERWAEQQWHAEPLPPPPPDPVKWTWR